MIVLIYSFQSTFVSTNSVHLPCTLSFSLLAAPFILFSSCFYNPLVRGLKPLYSLYPSTGSPNHTINYLNTPYPASYPKSALSPDTTSRFSPSAVDRSKPPRARVCRTNPYDTPWAHWTILAQRKNEIPWLYLPCVHRGVHQCAELARSPPILRYLGGGFGIGGLELYGRHDEETGRRYRRKGPSYACFLLAFYAAAGSRDRKGITKARQPNHNLTTRLTRPYYLHIKYYPSGTPIPTLPAAAFSSSHLRPHQNRQCKGFPNPTYFSHPAIAKTTSLSKFDLMALALWSKISSGVLGDQVSHFVLASGLGASCSQRLCSLNCQGRRIASREEQQKSCVRARGQDEQLGGPR